MKNKMRALPVLLLIFQTAHAATGVKIVQLSGEVKVRRGVEEKWEAAAGGMPLEESDTIMTLEAGEVVLELANGSRFRLSANAILDISELREITERELFLVLMQEKVGKLKPDSEKIPLRIGAVSAVRASDKSVKPADKRVSAPDWQLATNAARALRAQDYLTNAALKLHRVQKEHPARADCGEVSFELAQTFEALRQKGKARDAYQAALAECKATACRNAETQKREGAINEALRRLQ